ncbi:MAG: site-2 protease family protein [Gammaproteobacteria bacterium]|nr:site-2 protease family protein [Gammaproteobacteria bacterium]
MLGLSTIQYISIAILPLLFAITVHEVAHGWVAARLGDKTALMLGRLTLNPLKHIDLVGTILVPASLLLLSSQLGHSFVFGWAKPVPVTWQNLHNPKRDMALVAFAGPFANLLMAIGWAMILKLGLVLGHEALWYSRPMILMAQIGISVNLVLMVLNLLPIPPLDGGRILTGLLPGPWAWKLARVEPYGFFILIGLIATGLLAKILLPVVSLLQNLLYMIFGT